MDFNIKELAKGLKEELSSVEVIGEDKLSKLIKETFVDPNERYEKPISLIQMAGDNEKVYDVCTAGNISLTIGAAKSKKTFYSTMIASALLGHKEHGIIGNNQGLKTIFFDTEQSKYHVQRLNRRIKKIVGNLLNFEIYSLRELNQDERKALVEHYLKQNNGEYSFCFIDGIVDLLWDFNNQTESASLINDLMKWTSLYNCHINVVLHITVGFGNAKGHLGSLLTNKVECVFRVTKEDDNTSKVTCDASRNEGFPEFCFRIDNQGLPVRDVMPINFYDNSPQALPEIIDNTQGLTNGDAPF